MQRDLVPFLWLCGPSGVGKSSVGFELFDQYADAIPSAAWTVCRLRARQDTLAERISQRGRGQGPPIMGDDLRGRPEAELRQHAATAARIADALDHAGIGDLGVDTDGREVAQLADLVRAAAAGMWRTRHRITGETVSMSGAP